MSFKTLAELETTSFRSSLLPRPFIKWVGGKSQILHELTKRLPAKFTNYFEPFVGGGALLFSLDRESVSQISINDKNPELINLYTVIRDDVFTLMNRLSKFSNTEANYYKIRQMDRKKSYSRVQRATKAARFLYLNKTGYNGLYRVNSRGENNVPFGHYRNPTILDAENLRSCSTFLQGVRVSCEDFELLVNEIDKKSFVYLDPPYVPVSSTSNFTSYTRDRFDEEAQNRLKCFCDDLNSKGAKFMLSNSSAPIVYDLYADYHIDEIYARRVVNCLGDKRGYVKELIVRNYV